MFDNYLGINTAGGNGKPKSKFAKRLNIKTKHVKHIRREAKRNCFSLLKKKNCRLGEKKIETLPSQKVLLLFSTQILAPLKRPVEQN